MFLDKTIFLSSWRLKRFQESSPFTRGCRKILPSCQRTMPDSPDFSAHSTLQLAMDLLISSIKRKHQLHQPLFRSSIARCPDIISNTVLHGFYQCLAANGIKTQGPHRLGRSTVFHSAWIQKTKICLGHSKKTICQCRKSFSLIASLQDYGSLPAGGPHASKEACSCMAQSALSPGDFSRSSKFRQTRHPKRVGKGCKQNCRTSYSFSTPKT